MSICYLRGCRISKLLKLILKKFCVSVSLSSWIASCYLKCTKSNYWIQIIVWGGSQIALRRIFVHFSGIQVIQMANRIGKHCVHNSPCKNRTNIDFHYQLISPFNWQSNCIQFHFSGICCSFVVLLEICFTVQCMWLPSSCHIHSQLILDYWRTSCCQFLDIQALVVWLQFPLPCLYLR